jgi:pilus assembly protein CpaF
MFGKRNGAAAVAEPVAPPPAPAAGAEIATRPQRVEPAAARPDTATAAQIAKRGSAAPAARAGPKATPGLEQLRNAQNGISAGSGVVTQIVREQSDYYHATKTTIYTALLNTIDLSQLAQLDQKAAGEEIRDIVAELVAIKNVSMSAAEQEHLVSDIINDVLGYGPLEPLLARDDIADIMVNGANRVFIEAAGSTKPARSATPVSPTAPGSTSSDRPCRWTGRP